MAIYLLVALGGALGSVGRFALNSFITWRWVMDFPLGTLVINVAGSFAIGFFAALPGTSDGFKKFFMVGICGGFTTFSAFSLQTFDLMQRGEWFRAGANAFGSVALCLIAVSAGFLLGNCFKAAR